MGSIVDGWPIIVAQEEEEGYMLRKAKEEYEKWGLQLNPEKSKCLGADRQQNEMPMETEEIMKKPRS